MITIYALKTVSINEKLLNLLYPLISKDKIERSKRFKFQKDAIHCLLGDILLRYALFHKYNIKINQLSFTYNDYQKPSIKDYADIHFNLSHSGDWLVCAINNQPVGVDVQEISPIDALSITKRYFTTEEQKYFINKNNDEILSIFYDLWCMKESYIKLTGQGLSLPLNSFRIDLDTKPINIINTKTQEHLAKIDQHYLADNYKLAVCTYNYDELSTLKQIYFDGNEMINALSQNNNTSHIDWLRCVQDIV